MISATIHKPEQVSWKSGYHCTLNLALIPNERLDYNDKFDDLDLRGEIIITIKKVSCIAVKILFCMSQIS
jgi:hypothetical protein